MSASYNELTEITKKNKIVGSRPGLNKSMDYKIVRLTYFLKIEIK